MSRGPWSIPQQRHPDEHRAAIAHAPAASLRECVIRMCDFARSPFAFYLFLSTYLSPYILLCAFLSLFLSRTTKEKDWETENMKTGRTTRGRFCGLFRDFCATLCTTLMGLLCVFYFAILRGTTLLALGEDDLALSDLNQAAKLNNKKDLYTLVRVFSPSRPRGRTVGGVRICS